MATNPDLDLFQQLYHYTDGNAAMKIIEMGMLRATSMTHLNDASEVNTGLDVIERYLEQFDTEEDKSLISHVQFLKSGEHLRDNLFVACASTHGDSVGQWVGYGGNSGYALGFKANDYSLWGPCATSEKGAGDDELDKEMPSLESRRLLSPSILVKKGRSEDKTNAIWRKVSYFEKDQFDECSKIIPEINRVESYNLRNRGENTEYVRELLLELACRFKNSSYAGEKEYRCVIMVSPNSRFIDFYAGKFGITPFVLISHKFQERAIGAQEYQDLFEKGEFPMGDTLTVSVSPVETFDSAIVGPSVFQEAAKDGIVRYASTVTGSRLTSDDVSMSGSAFRSL